MPIIEFGRNPTPYDLLIECTKNKNPEEVVEIGKFHSVFLILVCAYGAIKCSLAFSLVCVVHHDDDGPRTYFARDFLMNNFLLAV